MPLSDGTNAEMESPSPPLGWASKADLTDVKVYGTKLSPPCAKILLYLRHHDVPHEFVELGAGKGVTPASSYKKIPVLSASGRVVNDSFVILQQLHAALSGGDYDADLSEQITYGLQPSLECEVFDRAGDFKRLATKAGFPIYFVPAGILHALAAAPLSKKIRKKYPAMKPSIDYAKAFKAAMGDAPFHGGNAPSAQDVAYYGTVVPFQIACAGNTPSAVDTHLEDGGLADWFGRMKALMPYDA
ncbi:hypothetical protein M885DRAFT_615049 [Pelagophyceae sp. CCMP2097]|nr:hypothetical protein M885DRAFT_615049 [Pelagophyceae sp. CCMP2097]|mmetsp:Transcript_18923/g.65110  ORF Transcript_18923/g.65110 Transcript_18923/m.65110 type:complete len:244 (-) Transcript_18923:98-829(-)